MTPDYEEAHDVLDDQRCGEMTIGISNVAAHDKRK